MPDSSLKSSRRIRVGCLSVVTLVGLIMTAAAVVALVARSQIRSDTREVREFVQELPEGAAGGDLDLELDVRVAQLVVIPVDVGSAVRVSADYDQRYFKLEQTFEESANGRFSGRVRFGPVGSEAMAIVRVKLGAVLPVLRLVLPREVRITLSGDVYGSFGAMELGGLQIEATDMKISGGVLSISFDAPLQHPMDRFVIFGNKSSIEVTGLGNASPRTVILEQQFGQLDLDLRGRWVRDVDVRLNANVAGGGVWLPDNLEIEGLESTAGFVVGISEPEIQLPRMRLDVAEGIGRLLFIDTRPRPAEAGVHR